MATRAVLRLLKDAKELSENPIPNTSATPLDEDVLVWHANVTAKDGEFKGTTFHLHLHFTEEYPSVPPKVDLCTPLPHPNIFPNQHGCSNYICLDVLEGGDFASIELKDRPYTGWSSSYTVSSLLIQISSFLLDDKLSFAISKVTPTRAIFLANDFKCKTCPHTGLKPFPPTQNKAASKPIHVISLPQMITANKIVKLVKPPAPVPKTAATVQPQKKTLSAVVKKVVEPVVQKQPEWETVTYKKNQKSISFGTKKARPSPIKVAVVSNQPTAASQSTIVPQRSLTMAEKLLAIQKAEILKSQHDTAQARQAAHAALLAQHQQNFQSLSASQQKRKQKQRQLKKQKKSKATQIQEQQKPVETTSTTVVANTEAKQLVDESEEQDGFEEVKKTKKEVVVEHQWASKRHAVSAVTYDPSVIPSGSKGNLNVLPYQMIITILELLPVSSVNAMSLTCRSLHQICQDGVLWQALFKRNHPHSQLSPQNMKDWKRLFALEVDQVVASLVCFHTKVNFLEDVLGLPITFTVNPRTQQIDYVYSSMDILSRQAFYEDKTVWKEKFTHFLPIYIDEDHFRRGLPIIKKTMSDMCGGGGFDPAMVLYILPKLMNTMIVLLMDKGVYASQKALDGYWMIHRLFIAMVQEHPQLKPSIDKRLRDFAGKEECRVKSEMPSLGDFLPLLSVSDSVKWRDLCWVYLNEVFDRNVLWIGKEDATLVTGPLDGPPVDQNRLKKTFEAVRVSLRLTLFHVHFLRMKGEKNMDTIASEYDLFYGRPSHTARITFQKAVAAIIDCPGWEKYFPLLGLVCPPPGKLTSWLRSSVKNSLKKGYHTARTNFGAIQKSGVSSILKKGETYKTSSQLKKVKMEESWGWTGSTRFLDASCLAYSGGKRIGLVDYSHTSDLSGSIIHSGDVMDHQKNEGKHTINVYLGKLPKEVDSLWFTMTAYTGDLNDIKQPFVRFTDEESDEELCRYNLESQKTGSNTAITMCSMTRIGGEQWSVKAIGHIGMGKVPIYGPIEKDIAELMKKK
ncbi:hypothetical protein PROFUN_04561 [Planoprotostelium fungivorum]|uniref:UBC core domain-containing protein n=1 Tax=Planoprotostelium fungivorum TaxID=1890364 RepID=A0A2P6NBJ1_9EUKA|nr:hypothetical protein PROFUN_04561 [Planoprotostelium fungivorum]